MAAERLSVDYFIYTEEVSVVQLDPRCILATVTVSPGLCIEIPCFACSRHKHRERFLQSTKDTLARDLRQAFPERLNHTTAQYISIAFIRSVIVPADASHRCPAPGNLFSTVHFSEIMLHTEESLFEERQPVTKPASRRAVIELVEESKESGAMHDDCVICMEEIDERALKLPCRHEFHQACLLEWFNTNHVCPLCRHPMPTDDNN